MVKAFFPGSRLANNPDRFARHATNANFERIDALKAYAADHGHALR